MLLCTCFFDLKVMQRNLSFFSYTENSYRPILFVTKTGCFVTKQPVLVTKKDQIGTNFQKIGIKPVRAINK